jgi:hypothetical protein
VGKRVADPKMLVPQALSVPGDVARTPAVGLCLRENSPQPPPVPVPRRNRRSSGPLELGRGPCNTSGTRLPAGACSQASMSNGARRSRGGSPRVGQAALPGPRDERPREEPPAGTVHGPSATVPWRPLGMEFGLTASAR